MRADIWAVDRRTALGGSRLPRIPRGVVWTKRLRNALPWRPSDRDRAVLQQRLARIGAREDGRGGISRDLESGAWTGTSHGPRRRRATRQTEHHLGHVLSPCATHSSVG